MRESIPLVTWLVMWMGLFSITKILGRATFFEKRFAAGDADYSELEWPVRSNLSLGRIPHMKTAPVNGYTAKPIPAAQHYGKGYSTNAVHPVAQERLPDARYETTPSYAANYKKFGATPVYGSPTYSPLAPLPVYGGSTDKAYRRTTSAYKPTKYKKQRRTTTDEYFDAEEYTYDKPKKKRRPTTTESYDSEESYPTTKPRGRAPKVPKRPPPSDDEEYTYEQSNKRPKKQLRRPTPSYNAEDEVDDGEV